MSWMQRFSLIMRSNLTVITEQFECPERMMHQLLIDMDEELEIVRRNVAEALADEIQLGKRLDAARSERDQWLARAKSAIEKHDEKSAEAALDQKLLAATRVDELTQEYERHQHQTRKLRESVRELEEKIRQARQRQTLLLARMSRADSTRKINAVLNRSGRDSAFAELQRIEARVDRAEAVAEAYDQMDGRDPKVDELERQFEDQRRADQLRQELESLRQTVNSGEATP